MCRPEDQALPAGFPEDLWPKGSQSAFPVCRRERKLSSELPFTCIASKNRKGSGPEQQVQAWLLKAGNRKGIRMEERSHGGEGALYSCNSRNHSTKC